MKQLILHLLLLLFPLQLFAFVEVRDGVFYLNDTPWRALGVNISTTTSNKQAFHEAAKFGCNSLRVTPTSIKQLRNMVKWAKSENIKLYVVVNADIQIEKLKSFKKKREIWAWEVENSEIAKKLKSICPNHLVSITSDNQFNDLNTRIDQIKFSQYIDFLAIPLLPIENKWVAPSNLYLGLRNAYLKTDQLMQAIAHRMYPSIKPIVVSECSYPRDKMFRLPESQTSSRDSYFSFVMNYALPNEERKINGVYFNIWELHPEEDNDSHLSTYSIYPSDSTTQQIIIQQ